VNETNTLSRLALLRDQDLIPDDLYRDVCRAFDYDVHLLLVHQLRFVEEGNRPQNFVTPAELSDLERKTLQFSFSVIEKMMDFVKRELNVTSKTVPPVVAKPRRSVLSSA
jgi:CBS domain-containing protein